jgi:hypothetical protein
VYITPKSLKKLLIKNPSRKRRDIEDFSLKSLRMRGNKSPAPPVYLLKGGELNPKRIKKKVFNLNQE